MKIFSNYMSSSKYWKKYDAFTIKKENSLVGPTWKSVVAMADMINPLINGDEDSSLESTFISFLKVIFCAFI